MSDQYVVENIQGVLEIYEGKKYVVFLEYDSYLSSNQVESIRTRFEDVFDSFNTTARVVILEDGLELSKARMDHEKKELIEQLENAKDAGIVDGHVQADEALLQYIDDPEVTEKYNQISKLYS